MMRTALIVMAYLGIFLGTFLGTFGAARAQDITAEQRAACKDDYSKFCKGTIPGGGRILACLNKQHDKLSVACRAVVDAQKK